VNASSPAMVHWNGRVVPKSEVRVDPDDRGFLFGDGVYEVLRVRRGLPTFVDRHHARLVRSCTGCELAVPFDRAAFEAMARALIAANGIGEGIVYLQVTRGVAPRNHAFPAPGTTPTVYAFAKTVTASDPFAEGGVGVIMLPDERWGRVDMKTINLLPNVLASERAARAGCHEAFLVRDGVVTEASHSNAWAVVDGVIRTHPSGPHILPGVTRSVVLEAAQAAGLPLEQRAFTPAELERASEAFLSGTTVGVTPVVTVDGRSVGDGRPGPVARALADGYARIVEADLAQATAR